jgi:hypothetical protein
VRNKQEKWKRRDVIAYKGRIKSLFDRNPENSVQNICGVGLCVRSDLRLWNAAILRGFFCRSMASAGFWRRFLYCIGIAGNMVFNNRNWSKENMIAF